ncbi:ImuA protein [Hyphomicrobium sp.]|uniref:ImuA family protein n=1 Tax=Hyphomicrobium sp. TaxID=82 RepID=UPI0025BE1170|nr:ImuA protein [Hyphomicrobium sp.]MCC7253248.1 ImuA protein [Hyphomicrobium sp.]
MPPAAPSPSRAEIVADLRRHLVRMEGMPADGEDGLSFGLSALDARLPQGGLAFGAVHEIAPANEADLPSAFGFLLALLARMPERSPLLLVLSSKKLARFGRPHGHGIAGLGLDPARLILVETADETEALWATEEAVRARGPAAVAAALGGRLDLKASQRLLHAARDARLPLLLLRPGGESVPTATTRWRIAAAPGTRDRFGMLSGWRWQATLQRCRNGRPGEWMLEFDHATHRFGLAAAVAGASLAGGGATQALGRAG